MRLQQQKRGVKGIALWGCRLLYRLVSLFFACFYGDLIVIRNER